MMSEILLPDCDGTFNAGLRAATPVLGPDVSFMIATRNRAGELRKTLESCRKQVRVTTEVLVVDDASTDGTYEIVRREFPEVNIVRREKNRGSIAARNDILRRARGKYIVGLDDDSRFIETDACRRIVERLDREPDLGIVSFQAIGPEFSERMSESGRLTGEWHTSSFAACGVAIRREMCEHTGLLAEYFFHMYEEPDLCLRAWDAGYRVLQWNNIVVFHEFSPLNRNEQRNHRRHARNEACSIWMRYPWRLVLPATAYRLFAQSRYAASRGWLLREPRVWAEAFARLPAALVRRRSVSERAVKIAVAVNRLRVADPKAVWELGTLPWREILRGTPNRLSESSSSASR
jgi:GT2 family glycosyltransferase